MKEIAKYDNLNFLNEKKGRLLKIYFHNLLNQIKVSKISINKCITLLFTKINKMLSQHRASQIYFANFAPSPHLAICCLKVSENPACGLNVFVTESFVPLRILHRDNHT